MLAIPRRPPTQGVAPAPHFREAMLSYLDTLKVPRTQI